MTRDLHPPRIFADFHNSDPQGRVRLNTVGTIEDLNRLGILLQEGMAIVVSSYELEADGTVTYTNENLWAVEIDWTKVRDTSAEE